MLFELPEVLTAFRSSRLARLRSAGVPPQRSSSGATPPRSTTSCGARSCSSGGRSRRSQRQATGAGARCHLPRGGGTGLLRRSVKSPSRSSARWALDDDWHATARALPLAAAARRRRIAAFVLGWQEPSTPRPRAHLARGSRRRARVAAPLLSISVPADRAAAAPAWWCLLARGDDAGVLAIEGVDDATRGPVHASPTRASCQSTCTTRGRAQRREEFVANTLRCGPLRELGGLPDLLGEVYDDVLAHPLQIAPNMATVDSIADHRRRRGHEGSTRSTRRSAAAT